MKITCDFIWRVLPVPIVIVDQMPAQYVGLSLGPVVVLHRDYAGDKPTIVHELVHCRQFWRGGAVVHWLRYACDLRYRLAAELEAFVAEIESCPPAEQGLRTREAAHALSACYGLDLSREECETLLQFMRTQAGDPRRGRSPLPDGTLGSELT